jgi:hypothetical protein
VPVSAVEFVAGPADSTDRAAAPIEALVAADCSGPSADLNWVALDWVALDWVALDWVALDWVALDWVALDWVALDWTGSDWLDSVEIDPDREHSSSTRLNWTDPNWADLNSAGLNSTGLDSTDLNSIGSPGPAPAHRCSPPMLPRRSQLSNLPASHAMEHQLSILTIKPEFNLKIPLFKLQVVSSMTSCKRARSCRAPHFSRALCTRSGDFDFFANPQTL